MHRLKPGIVLDFNAKKQVVGIEVLDPAKAAEHSMSLSRYIGEVLRKELRHSREYQKAMQRFLAEKPASLKRPGEGYLTREEANDRSGLRRR